MIDREKVIKGIEQCIKPVLCRGCPYRGKGECVRLLMENVLVLLKADQVELISQREHIESLEELVDQL